MTTSFRLSTRRFGELLVERGRLTPDQLTDALKARQDSKERLGQTLGRLGQLTEREVVELLAQQFSLPLASAERPSEADPQAVQPGPRPPPPPAELFAPAPVGEVLGGAL